MSAEETNKKVEELQILENQLQSFLAQKQTIQIELNEAENALEEVRTNNDEIYKITSGFLIRAEKKNVIKELEEKKRLLRMRIEATEKQERLIEKDVTKLRQEISKLISGKE